ncbi:MAG: excinuclease ABC subunit UvrC [Clostridia bacterium]|nr:excinuclease ABC subunit UvrC [Clostridia bacterium]
MTVLERLRDKANSLPMSPGVYIMKNADGQVIYVGKSKKLKNRVTSYFTGTGHSYKTAKMVSHVRDFDYVVCSTEIEALTLENVLIKKHIPRYNIKLKDAKSYPYIKITAEVYPKLFVTRDRKSDKGKYFGPYQSSEAAHTALEAVMRIFTLPTCKRSFPRDIGKERPCIYRDMGRCIAPCAGGVSAEEYSRLVKCAEWVLSGNSKETKTELAREMQRASDELEFERAAVLRDSINALDKLSEKQKVVADLKVNRDVFAVYVSDTEGALAVLTVREGALINKQEFILSAEDAASSDDVISLIANYYDGTGNLPREIMLDFPLSPEDTELLSEYLSIGQRHKVTIRFPERGDGRALCDMAEKNAMEASRQYRLEGEREDKSLRRLAELLGLSELPRRIEAYDVSNIGNENIVASMVVYQGGKLKKSDYRIFNIKTTAGADDYGAMREALRRRLSHIGDGTASLGEDPDMLLIDGGATHVAVAREVAAEMNTDVLIYGMVKDEFHKTRALTDGGADIAIAREMNVYALIYKIQEEAHRFALKNSQGAKARTMTHSSLEKIKGIGAKKAKLLLSKMTLSEIRSASEEELSKIDGISARDAEEICRYFKEKRKEVTPRVKNNNRNG